MNRNAAAKINSIEKAAATLATRDGRGVPDESTGRRAARLLDSLLDALDPELLSLFGWSPVCSTAVNREFDEAE